MGIGALRGSESEIDYQKSRKWIDSDTGERDGEASGGVPLKNAINPCPMFSLRSKTSNLYSPSKILIDDARLKVMYAHNSREI